MFCNHCGKEIKDGTKYCPNCGSQIHWQTISEISELKSTKKTHKRRKRIRNGLLLMLALAVIAMGILYFFGEFPVSRWQGDENIAEDSGSTMSVLGEGFTDRKITDGVSAVLAAQDASDTLGFANAFDELSVYVSATVDNECYYRLQQYYNGIPVYQRYVTVIATESGDALGIFTDAKDIFEEISLTPTITDEQAKESIQEYAMVCWEAVYDDMSISELSDDMLVIYGLDESESACLAYELTVFNDEEYHVILDAQNGEVLDCISTINEVSGLGTNVDGTLSFPVDYDEESDTYTIFDEEQQIYLFNLYGEDSTEALAGDTFDETAFENRKITSVGDNIFGNSEEEVDQDAETAVNLVTNIGLVIEYFENTFGQEVPYESMLLTYNDGYDEGNNACACPAIFTEDESVYGFLSIGLALDGTESHVLAHEYTHLIEDYYSAATGSNSDYGINEGLADTFACFYTLDWDIDLTMIGGTHRNAVDPSEYGYPSAIMEKYKADSDDIHAYATVISHAAYLMYDSGNFTMEELQKLWYKTLLKLPANCTYYDLRMCMEQTAIISGYSSAQQEVVSDVYDEIGIYDRYPCANSIDLFIYDKQGNPYDDCTVIISGETAGGLFGIGSKSYDLTLLWDSSEACNIELDDGTYEITIIDNANSSVETVFFIEVDDSNADQSLYAFDYGADYVAVSGAELIVLDVDGNEFSDYSASASMDGDSCELESGLIDLPIGNYYRIVLKSRDDSAGVTYYKMFTLRVKDGAENKVTVETSFSGMESGTDVYDAYDEILQKYRDACSISSEDYLADSETYEQHYPDVNAYVMYQYHVPYHESPSGDGTDEAYELMYAYFDIDQNGTPELLIFQGFHENYICDIYTYDGRGAVKLFPEITLLEGEVDGTYITIYVDGTISVSSGDADLYQINDDGYTLSSVSWEEWDELTANEVSDFDFILLAEDIAYDSSGLEAESETDNNSNASEDNEAEEDTKVYSGTCGNNLTWVLNSNGELRISGVGEMDDYSLRFTTPWEDIKDSITSVIIDDGVISIGNYAFFSCKNIKNVTMTDSVTSIGGWAFESCENLTSITVSDNLDYIGAQAFYSCRSLESFTIPNGVTNIDTGTFAGCHGLTSIVIPDSVTNIGASAFSACLNLKSVTISKSLIRIDNMAFRYSSNITDVYYAGSEGEWDKIIICPNNASLTSATIHYNSN